MLLVAQHLLVVVLLYGRTVHSFSFSYNSRSPLLVGIALGSQSPRQHSFLRDALEGGGPVTVAVEKPYKKNTEKPYQRIKIVDVSSFRVGQVVTGVVRKIIRFGILVALDSGHEVLLPNSQLTQAQMDRARDWERTSEALSLVLVTVDSNRGLLTGRPLPQSQPLAQTQPQPTREHNPFKSLEGLDWRDRLFKGTVISVHPFGVFVRVAELGIDGLVPPERLGKVRTLDAATAYPVGSELFVTVEEVNVAKSLVTLRHHRAVRLPSSKDLSALPQDRWLLATVTGTTKYALFARPAGHDVSAFLHQSQVPLDVISILRASLRNEGNPIPTGKLVDLDKYFREGDIIRIRIEPSADPAHPLQATMLPFKAKADGADVSSYESNDSHEHALALADHVTGGQQRSWDALAEYVGSMQNREAEDEAVPEPLHSVRRPYDPQRMVVWWRGRRFRSVQKVYTPRTGGSGGSGASGGSEVPDPLLAILDESAEMVAGRWRRVVDVDMAVDSEGMNEKLRQAEERQLREETAGLEGIEAIMARGAEGFDVTSDYMSCLGNQCDLSLFPDEWTRDFLRNMRDKDARVDSALRRGRKADEEDMRRVIATMNQEVAQRAAGVSQSPQWGAAASGGKRWSRRVETLEAEAPSLSAVAETEERQETENDLSLDLGLGEAESLDLDFVEAEGEALGLNTSEEEEEAGQEVVATGPPEPAT